MPSEDPSKHFDRFETILETISREIVVFDADGNFVYGNTASRKSGNLDNLLKQPSLDEMYKDVEFRDGQGNLMAPEDYPSIKARNGVASYGNIFQFINKKTGGHVWYESNSIPVLDDDGKVINIIISYQDVTAKKTQEEKLKFLVDAFKILAGTLDFNMLLENTAKLMVPTLADWSAIDILDKDGVLKRLTVVHQDPEMIGLVHEVDAMFPPDPNAATGSYHVAKTGKAEFVPVITDEMLTQGVQNEEALRLLRRLNLQSIITAPICARGQVLGTLSLVFAESGRHYTQEDVEFASDFCNHIGILLDNAKLYQQIESENLTKERFLAVLSHELRNPLAPIKNALELLKMKNNDASLIDEIDIIDHQFDHLTKLLRDLLDMNRLMHGRLELKNSSTDLGALVKTVVKTTRLMTDEKNIALNFVAPEEEVWAMIDPVRIEQVLINVLHNAEKFTSRGGRIDVTMNKENEMAVVQITDNGIGIGKDDIGKIFDVYFQGVKLNTYSGGLGMGLPLVRQIVELHGGTVSVQSEGPGRGSTFIIKLPLATTAERDAAPASADINALSNATKESSRRADKKILVIDDNRFAADSLAKLLGFIGYETNVAYGGKDGVDAFAIFSPDMAIIDLGMADMDGYTVAKTLRRTHDTAVPLIALSGYGMADDVQQALAAGFDHHLTKPAELKAIKELLKKYDL